MTTIELFTFDTAISLVFFLEETVGYLIIEGDAPVTWVGCFQDDADRGNFTLKLRRFVNYLKMNPSKPPLFFFLNLFVLFLVGNSSNEWLMTQSHSLRLRSGGRSRCCWWTELYK